MKKLAVSFFSFYALFALSAPLYAAQNNGATSGILLRMGGNARSAALGEAYGAVGEDATAIFFNPASLTQLERNSLELMHAVHINPIFFDNIAFARLFSKGVFGAGLQYLSFGSLDEIDNQGTKLGSSIAPKDLAVTLSYAGKLVSDDFSLGASAKYIQSSIKNTATAFALDLGLIYRIKGLIPVGLSLQNFGTGLKFNKETDSLPAAIRASSAWRPKDPILLAADISLPLKGAPGIALGAEYEFSFANDLHLSPRLGLNTRTQGSGLDALSMLSFGFGAGTSNYSLDYAINSLGDLGLTHKLSLSLKLK